MRYKMKKIMSTSAPIYIPGKIPKCFEDVEFSETYSNLKSDSCSSIGYDSSSIYSRKDSPIFILEINNDSNLFPIEESPPLLVESRQ